MSFNLSSAQKCPKVYISPDFTLDMIAAEQLESSFTDTKGLNENQFKVSSLRLLILKLAYKLIMEQCKNQEEAHILTREAYVLTSCILCYH